LHRWAFRQGRIAVGVAAVALVACLPAAASAQTGLTATKVRPIVDTLTLVGPDASTTDQVGSCVQPRLRRIDCEVDHVRADDGAMTCARIVTVQRARTSRRRASQLRWGSYACPLSAVDAPVVPTRRVSRSVLSIAAQPPEVIVSCPAGAPGCPSAADLTCASAADCAPLRVSYCAQESASCPTVKFERCPPARDPCTPPGTRSSGAPPCDPAVTTCTATPPSPNCVRDTTLCASAPVVDCADQPLQCAAAPTSGCTGLLECAPVLNLLGCATAVTPCVATRQPAGQSDVQPAAGLPPRYCRPARVKVLVRQPRPAHRRTRVITVC
jgi:hypothetical protein